MNELKLKKFLLVLASSFVFIYSQNISAGVKFGDMEINVELNITDTTCWKTNLDEKCSNQKILFSKFDKSKMNKTCELFFVENGICTFKNDTNSTQILSKLKEQTLYLIKNSTNYYILENLLIPYANMTNIIYNYSNSIYSDSDPFEYILDITSNSTNVINKIYKHSLRKSYEAIGLNPNEFNMVVKEININSLTKFEQLNFQSAISSKAMITLPTLKGKVEIEDSLKSFYKAKEIYKNKFDYYVRNNIFLDELSKLILSDKDVFSLISSNVDMNKVKNRYYLNETNSFDPNNLAYRYCFEKMVKFSDLCNKKTQREICIDILFSNCIKKSKKKYGDFMLNEYYENKEILNFNIFNEFLDTDQYFKDNEEYINTLIKLSEEVNKTLYFSKSSNQKLKTKDFKNILKSKENEFRKKIIKKDFPKAFELLLTEQEKIKVIKQNIKIKKDQEYLINKLKLNITKGDSKPTITIIDSEEKKIEITESQKAEYEKNKDILKDIDKNSGNVFTNLWNSFKDAFSHGEIKITEKNTKTNRFLNENVIGINSNINKNIENTDLTVNDLPILFSISSLLGCTKESKVLGEFLNDLLIIISSSQINDNKNINGIANTIDENFAKEVLILLKFLKASPNSLFNMPSPDYDEIFSSKLYNKKFKNSQLTLKDEVEKLFKNNYPCYMIINDNGIYTCERTLMEKSEFLADPLFKQKKEIKYLCNNGSCLILIMENDNYSLYFKGKLSFDLIDLNRKIADDCYNGKLSNEECCHMSDFNDYQNTLTKYRIDNFSYNDNYYSNCENSFDEKNDGKCDQLYKSSLSINIPTLQSDFDLLAKKLFDNKNSTDIITFKDPNLDSNKMYLDESEKDTYSKSKTGYIFADENQDYEDLMFNGYKDPMDLFLDRIAGMNLLNSSNILLQGISFIILLTYFLFL